MTHRNKNSIDILIRDAQWKLNRNFLICGVEETNS
jgi:hypothetical protein